MAVRVAHTKSMDDSTRLEKNRRIAQSRKETRERRKNKDILVAHRSSASHGSQEERSGDRDSRLWRENAA